MNNKQLYDYNDIIMGSFLFLKSVKQINHYLHNWMANTY